LTKPGLIKPPPPLWALSVHFAALSDHLLFNQKGPEEELEFYRILESALFGSPVGDWI